MARSTVFTTNRTQAVRLPKAVAFPDDVRDVEIVQIGASRVVTPVGRRWDDFFLDPQPMPDDFLAERRDGPPQERDAL